MLKRIHLKVVIILLSYLPMLFIEIFFDSWALRFFFFFLFVTYPTTLVNLSLLLIFPPICNIFLIVFFSVLILHKVNTAHLVKWKPCYEKWK